MRQTWRMLSLLGVFNIANESLLHNLVEITIIVYIFVYNQTNLVIIKNTAFFFGSRFGQSSVVEEYLIDMQVPLSKGWNFPLVSSSSCSKAWYKKCLFGCAIQYTILWSHTDFLKNSVLISEIFFSKINLWKYIF